MASARTLTLLVILIIVVGLGVGYYLSNRGGGLEFKEGYAVALPMGGGAFMTIHNGYKSTGMPCQGRDAR